MVVYVIYEKNNYKQMPLIKKISFNVKDNISETVRGFTKHKNIAEAYISVNPNTYLKRYIITNNDYMVLNTIYPNKRIQCYVIASTNELIMLNTEEKIDRIKKGVEFYDYSE